MKRSDYDFGFSFFSDDEMKAKEQELSQVVDLTTQEAKTYKERFETLREMVMPLLQNLTVEPDKTWLHWPNRATQAQAFIDKINKV